MASLSQAAAVATAGGGDDGVKARGTEYAELLRRVKTAGLLDRRLAYYVRRIAITAILFGAGWTVFVLLGESWWQLAVAAFLAFVFTQTGFIGHDAGHGQIFRTRRANFLVGLIHGNLAIGLSYGWWVAKHARHHANPNHEDKDPDVNIGALAFTAEQAKGKRGIAQVIARNQRWFFIPLLLLEGVQLHVSSVRALRSGGMRSRAMETVLLSVHAAAYLGGVLMVLSPVKALIFVVVHQGLFGLYLGLSFAPNHKGMPILTGDGEADFLRRQVLTSRNVHGGALVDYLLGGLNYQIEHHLFPSMPRPNLRRSQDLIKTFCQEHGIAYLDSSLWRSYGQALRHLHQVGQPLRTTVAS